MQWRRHPKQAKTLIVIGILVLCASAFTIADNMGLDREIAASAVFATTLLSVLTLPAFVALLT